jgi:hypothetical protein
MRRGLARLMMVSWIPKGSAISLNRNTALETILCRAGLLVYQVKSWGHSGHSSIRVS